MGRLGDATAAIRRALSGKHDVDTVPGPGLGRTNAVGTQSHGLVIWDATPVAPGSHAFEVPTQTPFTVEPADIEELLVEPTAAPPAATTPVEARPVAQPGPGEFTEATYKQSLQSLRYKLYIPPDHAGRRLPLVVMLHGCTQDPDDFALGTRMNELGREMGFFVLYPAQAQSANPSRCWNWFKRDHQQRDSGEPALIAGATQAVIRQHDIDANRVFIAGLSAGGAMAAIVAEAYPEIFAAAGIHSGLPRGAASNMIDALSVMRKSGAAPAANHQQDRPVPTIVFHGDGDLTVHPRNGEHVLAAALGQPNHSANSTGGPQVEKGVSGNGRSYTRSIHRDDNGHVQAEHWAVHGAGHAWSGGDPNGSYTDINGPDATRAMLEFFFNRSNTVVQNAMDDTGVRH